MVTIEDTPYDLGEELSALLEEAHYDRTTDVFKLEEDGDVIEVSQSETQPKAALTGIDGYGGAVFAVR